MSEKDDIALFKQLISENRYQFDRLVFIIFPFGQKGTPLEYMYPYDWQLEEWRKLSAHLSNPLTRYKTYRLIISSGNGAAKTAFGCMTLMMLMYTQRLKARITANTYPQLSTVVWPEMDIWFRHARFVDKFFDKKGESIKALNKDLSEVWRIDKFTWSAENPSATSGLHNKGGAVCYMFEEAPGIPAVIWQYAAGAFTETETIKIFMAFGNSDDPESKFEQNMSSPIWRTKRIDTRELSHIDKDQIKDWLTECGGDEDHDDFRVRVRGLPRKSSKDAIIAKELVIAAIKRREGFDKKSVAIFPVIIGVDPAWQGGDETVIWYRQGHYTCMLEKYKLSREKEQDHTYTYIKVKKWEKELRADKVFIDQGEGTALYTLAMAEEKYHWELVSFASSPTDAPTPKESEYGNRRAQMYYMGKQALAKEGFIIDFKESEWKEDIEKQFSWTKGARHKKTHKKMAEPKLDIKARVGKSPDVSDGWVLLFADTVSEKLPENDRNAFGDDHFTGGASYKMPEPEVNYDIEVDYVYD